MVLVKSGDIDILNLLGDCGQRLVCENAVLKDFQGILVAVRCDPTPCKNPWRVRVSEAKVKPKPITMETHG
jgi:hypothetical protein